MPVRLLIVAMVALSVLGFAALALVLGGSLRPTERANANLERIWVGDVHTGDTKLVERRELYSRSPLKESFLVVRGMDDVVNVWSVPTRNGKVLLPDVHWFRPMVECSKFGVMPSRSVKGLMVLGCASLDRRQDWASYWEWTFDGVNVSGSFSDMEPVLGYIHEDEFVIGKGAR